MNKLRLVSPAYEELRAAALFYDDSAPGLGSDFMDSVEQLISRLLDSPRIGKPILSRLRSFPISKYPFDLVYLVDTDELVIVAIAHQSRRPGYWMDRIS